MKIKCNQRCARVLAGKRLARRLPARTRAHRWLRLILKHHKPTAKFIRPLCGGRIRALVRRKNLSVGEAEESERW